MNRFLLCAAATAAIVLGGTAANAQQAPAITVTPTVAPNAFGSPSYAGWVTNSIAAQHDGLTSLGNPASPTFYQAQSNVNPSQVIVTSFPSWLGQQDPGTVFGPAFANELGNRMLFGLKVDGQGTQFSISELSFNAVSDDVGDGLGFGFGPGSYNYSADYEGVLKGADGQLWTSDDVFITSGANTQLVDGLVGRGSGNSFEATCLEGPCTTTAERQALLDSAAAATAQIKHFTGTYTLEGATGAGTFNIGAVPEPATWMLLLLGFGGIGGVLRRRRQAAFAG